MKSILFYCKIIQCSLKCWGTELMQTCRCHTKNTLLSSKIWSWGRRKIKKVQTSGWADQRRVGMSHLSLTFPVTCDHILQRPQYRMKSVLEKQAWKRQRWVDSLCSKARRGARWNEENWNAEWQWQHLCEGGRNTGSKGGKKWKSRNVSK